MRRPGRILKMDSFLSDLLASAEVQAFAAGFPTMLLHLAATLGLLVVGAAIYAALTPWKEIALIREGNDAAAVAFAGVLVGLAIPLATSLTASTSLREIGLWGVATLVIQLLAFRVVDAVLSGLPQRIREGEVSAAVVLVGAKLATALVLAAALSA